ncbi:hypothetical protein GGI42DRAFT_335256 [Trichoderma sp. SZMC 28013]
MGFCIVFFPLSCWTSSYHHSCSSYLHASRSCVDLPRLPSNKVYTHPPPLAEMPTPCLYPHLERFDYKENVCVSN